MSWKTAYRSLYYANAPEPETPTLTARDTALLVIDVQNTYLKRPNRADLSPADQASYDAWTPFHDRMHGQVILSVRDVKLSAAVLGVALVLEVLVLALLAYGVIMAETGTSFTLQALNPLKLMTPAAAQTVGTVAIPAGAAAVGIFMAFWSWVGFEMAPNYAEESRDAKRIVPQSLFISVIFLGVFYTIINWAVISAYPSAQDMLAKAISDSGNFFLDPMKTFVGPWASEVMSVLILT